MAEESRAPQFRPTCNKDVAVPAHGPMEPNKAPIHIDTQEACDRNDCPFK